MARVSSSWVVKQFEPDEPESACQRLWLCTVAAITSATLRPHLRRWVGVTPQASPLAILERELRCARIACSAAGESPGQLGSLSGDTCCVSHEARLESGPGGE